MWKKITETKQSQHKIFVKGLKGNLRSGDSLFGSIQCSTCRHSAPINGKSLPELKADAQRAADAHLSDPENPSIGALGQEGPSRGEPADGYFEGHPAWEQI